MLRLQARVAILTILVSTALIGLMIGIGNTRTNDLVSFAAEFDDQTDIYLYDPIHKELTNITNSIYPEWSFSWSISGALFYTTSIQLAQTSDELLVMNRLGDEHIIETPDTLFSFGGVWSPDGSTLAYYSSHPRNISDIYTISFPDLTINNLTQTDDISETNPLWSPNGDVLLYRIQGDLYSLDIESNHSEKLVDLEAAPIEMPVWSPDGQLIAFYLRIWSDGRNIVHAYTISADGDNLHQLSLPTHINSPVTWSPDGQKIALIADDNNLLIYDIRSNTYVSIEGENRRSSPSWSQDNRWIAFIENRQLNLYDLHSGQIHTLMTDGLVKPPLLWRP